MPAKLRNETPEPELVALGADLDRHAAAFAAALKKFELVVNERRASTRRGPSWEMFRLGIERCWARYGAGTSLRSKYGDSLGLPQTLRNFEEMGRTIEQQLAAVSAPAAPNTPITRAGA